MSEQTTVIDFMRVQFGQVNRRLDGIDTRLSELTQRVIAFETSIAPLAEADAHRSVRMDRFDHRLDRIERRLEMAP